MEAHPTQLWICISIFYNRDNCSILIKNAVKPVLATLKALGYAEGFICCFNSEQGENLRVSLLVDKDVAEIAVKLMHTKITSYLVAYPSKTRRASFRSGGLLMPFPNNSLHYNLYGAPCAPAERSLANFYFCYSSIMVDYFSSTNVNENSLFNLLFISLCVLLRCQRKVSSISTEVLEMRLTTFCHQNVSSDPDYFRAFDVLFQNNTETLVSISREVSNQVEADTPSDRLIGSIKASMNDFIASMEIASKDNFVVFFLTRCMIFQLGLKQDLACGLLRLALKCDVNGKSSALT